MSRTKEKIISDIKSLTEVYEEEYFKKDVEVLKKMTKNQLYTVERLCNEAHSVGKQYEDCYLQPIFSSTN